MREVWAAEPLMKRRRAKLPGIEATLCGRDGAAYGSHRRHLGPTHAALAFKNLSLDDALAVLREELQAETKAEAPAEPAAPPKPATTVPIKDRPFMRGTTSSGLASGA